MTAAERRVPVVIGAAEMGEIDQKAEALGLPTVALMENAGRAVAEVAAVELARGSAPGASPHVVILCGTGNNGGDGFVAARHLAAGGHRVTVVLVGKCGHSPPVEVRDLLGVTGDPQLRPVVRM